MTTRSTALNKKNTSLLLGGRQQKGFLHPLWGMQDIHASAKICNRCGACAQACPSYKVFKEESFSPRGRNQLLRFILLGYFKKSTPKKHILSPAAACIMCGSCTAACAAFVPTAKHAAAVRRGFGAGGGFWRGLRLKFFGGNPANLLAEAALTQNLPTLIKILDEIKAGYDAAPKPIIAKDIEAYRLLKLSPEIDEKYQTLAQNAVFITDTMKPISINQSVKILVQNNNIFFCGDDIPKKTAGLFVCLGNKFLVELKLGAQSAGLLPYCKIEGNAQIAKDMSARIAAYKADLFIVLSSADEKFFKKLLKKSRPGTKVLHISDAPEYFDEK